MAQAQDELDTVLRKTGAAIAEMRAEAGLTQEQAASVAGIDGKRWQRLEAGKVNPTIKTLVRVASALGGSFSQLLAKIGDSSAPPRT